VNILAIAVKVPSIMPDVVPVVTNHFEQKPEMRS
jgi:hypothetical protein